MAVGLTFDEESSGEVSFGVVRIFKVGVFSKASPRSSKMATFRKNVSKSWSENVAFKLKKILNPCFFGRFLVEI